MTKLLRIVFFLQLCLSCFECVSKSSQANSILNKRTKSNNNLQEAIRLSDLAWELLYSNSDSTILLANQAIQLLKVDMKHKNSKKKLYSLNKNLAMNYSIMGMGYFEKTNYTKALENLLRALKIDEAINNKPGIATRLGNLGNIYAESNNFPKAYYYYNRALKMDSLINNKQGFAHHLNNIANLYSYNADYEKSLVYYFRALKIYEETGEKNNLSNSYGNIGVVYKAQKNYEKGMEFYLKALALNLEIGNKSFATINYSNIGLLFSEQDKLDEAEKYFLLSLQLSKEIGSLDDIADAHQNLSETYFKLGRNKESFIHYKNHISVRDSVTNSENIKKQTQLEMQYEFDKQHTADSIKNSENAKQELIKHSQEIKQQKIYAYGGVIGFGLMLIVALVAFRAFKNKKKANLIIAEQKLLVETKQKEILDSIHYAKRIQDALLPSKKYIARAIKQVHKS